MIRRVLVAAAVLVTSVAAGGEIGLVVDRAVVHAGSSLAVNGAGFAPSSDVRLSLGGDTDLGVATTDERGAYVLTVTVPAGVVEGTHTLTATGPGPSGSARTFSTGLTVLAPLPPPEPETRPSDAGRLARSIALLVGVIAACTLFWLRERQRHPPARRLSE
jgi:hypothetical protein